MSSAMNKPRFQGRRVKLGEICTLSNRRNRDGECSSVYSVTNSRGFVPSEDFFSKEVYSKELKTYRVVERDMIAYNPSRINVGSVALQDKADEVIVSPLYVVFSVDEEKALPGYLVRFLKSKQGRDQISFRSTGTVRNSLKFDALCLMDLHLPSMYEQRTRVDVMTRVERLIGLRFRYLSKLDDLRKSRFIEMFGDPVENPMEWPCGKLGDIGDLRNGVNFKAADSGYEVKCLGVGDFKDRYAICDTTLISAVTLNGEPNEKQILRDGDIVFVRSNGNKQLVGRCVAVFPGSSRITFSGFCIRFRNESDRLLLDYMLGCLKSDSMRKSMIGRGANIQNLNQGLLAKVEMPLPPLSLQQEFASFVAQVDKLESAARASIDKLQTLYDSLAQEYFG